MYFKLFYQMPIKKIDFMSLGATYFNQWLKPKKQ